MKVGYSIGIFVVLAGHPVSVGADEFRCQVKEKYVCESGAGCKLAPLSVWVEIDTYRQTFARCDARGCDSYDAHFSVSGAFLNIDIPGRGMFAKMSDSGEVFVEAVTLGATVLISFGTCARR